jgi:hypothetical protein
LGLGTTLNGYFNSELNNAGGRITFGRTELVPVARVGGRWQKPGKHWFVRVAFTPFLKEYYTAIRFPFSPWAGISVGYNFGKN